MATPTDRGVTVTIRGLGEYAGGDLAGVLHRSPDGRVVGGFAVEVDSADFTTTQVILRPDSSENLQGDWPYLTDEVALLDPGQYTLTLWADTSLGPLTRWIPMNSDGQGLAGCVHSFEVGAEARTEVVLAGSLWRTGYSGICDEQSAGAEDQVAHSETTNAALDELAGSVEMSKGTVDFMEDLIWRETAGGRLERWDPPLGWQDMGPLAITDESEPLTDGGPWLHVVEDRPEVVWVLVSDQPTRLNQTLVEEGRLPPDPPEDLRFVTAVLALEHAGSPQAQFLIDCETNEGQAVVAVVLTTDDDRPIARAWGVRGPLEHVPVSQVTCP